MTDADAERAVMEYLEVQNLPLEYEEARQRLITKHYIACAMANGHWLCVLTPTGRAFLEAQNEQTIQGQV
jgi:hypothetical protein